MKLYARVLFGTCFGLIALVSAVSAQTPVPDTKIEINFDEIFEWKKPDVLTQERLESKVAAYENASGRKVCQLMQVEGKPEFWFSEKWSLPAKSTYSIFKNQRHPNLVRVSWQERVVNKIIVFYSAQQDEEFPPQLLTDMDAAFGVAHTFDTQFKKYRWSWANYSASAEYSTHVGKGEPTFLVHISRVSKPGESSPVATVTPPAGPAAAAAETTINLDELIDWKIPMNLSLEAFDTKIQALEKAAGKKLCRPVARENYAARFFDPASSAQGFNVKYSIFGGQYFLQSAYVDWKNGAVFTIDLVHLQTGAGQEVEPLQVIFKLDKMFGCPHVVEQDYVYSWDTAAFNAVLIKYSDSPGYGLRFHQPRNQPAVAVSVSPGAAPPSSAKPTTPTPAPVTSDKPYILDLDPLVQWEDPLSIEASQVETRFKPATDVAGRRLWLDFIEEERTYFGRVNSSISMTLFQGKLKVKQATVSWREPKEIVLQILKEDLSSSDENWLYDKLDELLSVKRRRLDLTRSDIIAHEWEIKKCTVKTVKNPDMMYFQIYIRRPVGFDPNGPTKPLAANLDALLNFSALWQWSPADLEKTYELKLENQNMRQKSPQFEWMSASKDRARFSRHMFSNVETKLTMFGRSTKVEEAILEFVNGQAARATISFYNRGDSGNIEVKEFDRIFKTIGQNLSQVMKVAPKRQMGSSNAALPVTGWNWTSPSGIALLEYNEYNTPGKESKPEFLRLKLAAPNQADWSMGKMATGVQRMELLQRVKKTPEGDVYISGVPMVDQGQKGYCVAASCQRLFEYMRIPCDQHEMAKLVSVDAEGGADISTMQKSLAKIDGAFKVTFKPLVNPELYYTNNGKRRVSEKEFISIVKEYTDKGVPLLWGLMLGRKPEDPPLPNAGQISGGHMRMVIGYNLAKNQVIFTDSWGAGHELKRMAMLDAYDVTMGLYSMAPRGL